MSWWPWWAVFVVYWIGIVACCAIAFWLGRQNGQRQVRKRKANEDDNLQDW